MIDVYHVPFSRSTRVLWLLEEIGQPCTIHTLGWPFPDSYRELNPTGAVPTAVDDGAVFVESMAACELLARRHGGEQLIVDPQDPAYADYLQALWFGEASLAQPLGAMFVYGGNLPGMPNLPEVAGAARHSFANLVGAVDKWLGDHPFIAGSAFTLADISVGFALFRGQMMLGEEHGYPARVVAYLDRLKARPAFCAALAKGAPAN